MRPSKILPRVLLSTSIASAQPSAQPPGVPAPYAYTPEPVSLTAEDQELLRRGEITDGQRFGGAGLGLVFGFGLGQAVQGRWAERGVLFTIGDAITNTAFAYGLMQLVFACHLHEPCDEGRATGLMVAGLFGATVLRVWQTADALIVPSSHNARVRALRARLGGRPAYQPYVGLPSGGETGGVAGLALSF